MFLVPLLLAQQFDVASVKPYRDKQISNVFQIAPNGDVWIANLTLRELVRSAYMLHESQLLGGPERFDSDRWSIDAKVGDTRVSKKESLLRLKNLIDQRFQIVTHRKPHRPRRDRTRGRIRFRPAMDGRSDDRASPGQPADLKPTDSGSGPSLYEALQRQLGLRLVAKKAPVDVVIVDRASHPQPN